MNSVQTVQVELLKSFIDICEKHGLQYYMVCGSALGAVKYEGFIPWDDDVDVALPRSAYEEFLRVAQNELPANVFLQNYKTDPCFPQLFSKLRNSETTFIETSVAHLDINHGAFIDVFPLDGYPAFQSEQRTFERKKRMEQLKLFCAYETNRSIKTEILYLTGRAFGYRKRTQKTVKRLERLISQYPAENSKIWCNHGNWQGKLEYTPQEQYGNGMIARFEGLEVRVPEDYDAYLTQKYGDWRSELPPEEQVGHHYTTVCDMRNPYTQYKQGRKTKTYE